MKKAHCQSDPKFIEAKVTNPILINTSGRTNLPHMAHCNRHDTAAVVQDR